MNEINPLTDVCAHLDKFYDSLALPAQPQSTTNPLFLIAGAIAVYFLVK